MLAIIMSITSAWITSNQIEGVFMDEGLNTTKLLADHSLLSVLYDSSENVIETVKTILEYPDIKHVLIENNDHHIILDKGLGSDDLLIARNKEIYDDNAGLLGQNRNNWYFVAPIILKPDTEAFSGESSFGSDAQTLGYVFISRSKETLHNIQLSTFLNHIGIALLIAMVLIIFVNLGIKYLTDPLVELAALMYKTEKSGKRKVAKVEGPAETMMIAEAFNKLMDSIDEKDKSLRMHNEILESVVEQRTRDLVLARDSALEASRYKSEILANTTHELRTPLQSIIGYTDVLLEDNEDDGNQVIVDDLKSIQKSANHLHLLISNILNIAKLESDQVDLHIEEVDVTKLVEEARSMVLPLVNERGNQLKIETHDHDHMIRADKDKLLQVLLNLIGNAAKFTRDGVITIDINRAGDLLEILVKDTGIGIDNSKLDEIFEPFHQADGSETRHYQGTGLGLAIVRKFVEALRGNVKVESEPGKGSAFFVYIPIT